MSTQPLKPPKPPSYLRHKAKNKAFIYLRSANGTRRTIYLPGAFNSPESHRRYREIVAAIMTGQPIDSPHESSLGGIGLAELSARFLGWAENYYRKPDGTSTGEFPNFVIALRPLLKLYRDEFARNFGPLKLKNVREEMVVLGWNRSVINKQVTRVKMMFRWGVENELVDPSVHQALLAVAGMKKGRCDAPEPTPITPVEWKDVEAVLQHLAPESTAMVLLQWHTGMRPGEVVRMRTQELDCDGDVWTYTPESHKTAHHGKKRVIQLGPNSQEILRPFLQLNPSRYLFQRQPKRQTQSSGRIRKHYSSSTYARVIRRACLKSEINPWSPNQLRHSRATQIRKRFGLEAAQVTLGHASADITQVYAERDHELARRVALETG